MIGRAEPQRVHVGDRTRAHGEHVAHDAANAGRRALIGLDIGRMVVALHFEHGRLAVAEIDNARVLAGPLDHLRAFGRQLPEPDFEDLYEQCSLHITEKTPSSVSEVRDRAPRASCILGVRPCSAAGSE